MECLVLHLFDFFYLIYRQIHHDSQSQIGGFKRQGDNMADANQKRRPAFGDITNVCDTISEIIYHQYPNI